MRDPDRIPDFCDKLANVWSNVPDWRFGQLICNVFGISKKDPFYMEEDEILKLFEDYFKPDERENNDE